MVDERHTQAELLLATLGRYLSDEIAPMIFVDAAEVLFTAPPEVVAAGIRGWLASQMQVSGETTIGELLYHAAGKLHRLGELELIEPAALNAMLEGLEPHLLEMCPEPYRPVLAEDLKRLAETETVMAARPEVLHRPVRDPRNAGAAQAAPAPGVPGGVADQAAVASAVAQGLGRLTLLLDRLAAQSPAVPAGFGAAPSEPVTHTGDRLPDAVTPPSGTRLPGRPSSGGNLVTRDLLAEVLAEVARSSRSGAELEGHLAMLRSLGLPNLGRSPLRTLARTLPDWAPGAGQVAPFGALTAMRQIVDLAREDDAVQNRFAELVGAATEEFNSGSLGRAVTLLDLAQRMVDDGTVDRTVLKNVVGQAYPNLDPVRLRTAAEAEEQHQLLRRVMQFFPQLGSEELLSELEVEERRDRRRTLIALLAVHGHGVRNVVQAVLRDGLAGTRRLPWHFERNLVYLLRTVPRHEGEDPDREIDLLVQISELGAPLPLVREAISALGQLRHERADTALAARVSEIEDALLGSREVPHEADDLRSLLDSAVALMARSPTAAARRAMVNHGLKRRPQLGDCLARLARLGGQDLSDDPDLVERLVRAVRDELPTKVLGLAVTTPRRARSIARMVEALSGTDTPTVRQLLGELSSQYAGQPFAEPASRALAELGRRPASEERPTASLSGDLQVFGLANLLQNLADTQLSGVLTLFDPAGVAAATVKIARGALLDASLGHLSGEAAVFQLLERPASGRFVFVNRPEDSPVPEVDEASSSITAVLLEGMRRYDELQRATALVPPGAHFRPTGRRPSAVAGESEPELVREVWRLAAGGRAPEEVESAVRVDSYRVRRLFEHWLSEGALAPAASDA